MMNLLASVSQWEREVIGERTKDAMQELKAAGKVYSRPVFDNADALALARREREAGRTYEEISWTLNDRGFSTARGGRWDKGTVRKILLRTAA
jgi:DNA invertase Pin-like site-specific DNA recombinase